MTTYGLTSTGFVRKPAAQIRADIITGIRSINGLQDARIGPGSVLGQLADVFTNELSIAWEGAEAVYASLSPDSASGQSLDNARANVGKSRYQATHSTATLTLWTYSTSGPVSVPAGNQASQSATGTLWETLADATIPAAVDVAEGLTISAIEWQSANTVRYTFSGSPDLSGFAAGDLLVVIGALIDSNNGAQVIITVNSGSYYVEATNVNRSSSTGDESGSFEAAITDGFITVAAQSVDAGAYEATAQSIDSINTPLTNWDGVANTADATTGRDRETDAAFRSRTALELVVAQGSTIAAIKAQLLKVAGVTYVAAEENRTATTDGNGNIPHSYRFTLVGGATQDIVDCIGTYGAGAIATNGATSGTYTDPEGVTTTIYFDRVTEVKPYIRVLLTTNADYPADGDDLITAALVALAFDHGEDLYNYNLITAVGASGVPGITGMTIYQARTAVPSVTTTITISATEQLNIVADRIAFV